MKQRKPVDVLHQIPSDANDFETEKKSEHTKIWYVLHNSERPRSMFYFASIKTQ